METGTLVHVDPSELLLDTNVRTTVKIDPDFKASIKSEGVLQPVVAVLTDDGLHVRMGQRRTIAAAEVGEPAIPVYVVHNDGDADRIIKQLAENDHRASLNSGERLDAVQQLSMIGVKPADIATRTRIKRKDVDTAIAIIGNDGAAKIAVEHNLTVVGWCMEFDGDEEAVTRILRDVDNYGEGHARHVVERLRQDRKDRAAWEAAKAATDLTVIERPIYSDKATAVGELVDDKGKDVTPAAHRACPGHAVVLQEIVLRDGKTPSLVQVDLVAGGRNWRFLPYCQDPTANGHRDRYASTSSKSSKAAKDDEAGRAAEKAERKRVVAGNKAWDAASVVRAEFVAVLLKRKAVPADAVLFCLRSLTGHVTLSDGRTALRDRLGIKDGYGQMTIADLAVPAATMAMLTYVVAIMEARTGRDDWRTVQDGTVLYLKALESWGYCLSDVEVAAAGGTPFTIAK